MRPLIGLALIIVLTLMAALADTMREHLWASYINYTSLYLNALPQNAPEAALSPRVIVVLVRGLRADVSRTMPALNKLRENGADITLELDPPLLPLPQLMTLFSGANAETHGITANLGPRGRIGADTIFLKLQARDKHSAIVGSELWDTLFGSSVSLEYAENDEQAIRSAINIANDPAIKPSLIGIELTAESGQWSIVNAQLSTLISTIDLSKNTLVVISDRGVMSDRVRLGRLSEADETAAARVPLVMAGVGIRPVLAAVKATAFAPTLALLLGVPMPIHSQSAPILPALQLPTRSLIEISDQSAAQLTTFYENWATVIRQPRFASELYQSQRTQIRSSTDARPLQNFEAELNTRRQLAQEARFTSDQLLRLPLLIGAILCMIGFIGLLISQRIWLPFLGALLWAGAWVAVFFYVRQNRFTFGMFPDANPLPFLNHVGQDYVAITLAAGLLIGGLAINNARQVLDAVTDVLATLALVTFAQALVVIWFVWQWDSTFSLFLPDNRALIIGLVALTQMGALLQPVAGFTVPIPFALGIFVLLMYPLRKG